MSEKLSASDNPANQEHLCAKQVVHETWGKGDCIPTMHAEATESGHVAWYDVMFEHGLETRVAVEDLEITLAEKHSHSKMKKEAKDAKMVCKDCGCEQGNPAPDCDCPHDSKDLNASCWVREDTIKESELVEKDAKDPCWEGYQMVGMKKDKNGKEVPNCVPMDEAMDPVNKKELKGKFDDRKDQDIDNDGDEDDSDKYLHMRRKAISKALKK